MKQQHHSITALPPSPDDERRGRMLRYSAAMGVRLICIFALVLVRDWWWIALFATGAIVLPYVAVVLANVHTTGRRHEVARPGTIERTATRPSATSSESPNEPAPDADESPGEATR